MTTAEMVDGPPRASRWRWIPLAAGVALWLTTPLTFGAGVALAPVGLAVTAVAALRVASPKGAAFWCGAVLNAWMGILFLIAVGIVVHDELVRG